MNKTRRQVIETTEIFLQRGLAVLTVDLFGTGDSDGEFADARWLNWKSNIEAAMDWADGTGLAIDSIVASRLGCILAAESIKDHNRKIRRSVFWQPVHSGSQFMKQFLRLRIAASMMASGNSESVADLRALLDQGSAVEVAGYVLSTALWKAIEAADLSAVCMPALGDLMILEVGAGAGSDLSMVSQKFVEAVSTKGLNVTGRKMPGEPYWAATEIVTNSTLTELTVSFLAEDRAP